MCIDCIRNPILCIVPPYMQRSIAENGSPAQRKIALENLAVDQTIRIVRATTAVTLTGWAARRRRAAATATSVAVSRTIRDAGNGITLPGKKVARKEGQGKTGDAAVDEAYDGLGATFDLFWKEYNRNSIDDAGMPLDATVHYGTDYGNAFWDGKQMVFGDGDRQLFNRFTVAVDIIGHELAHGVTEKETGLVYFEQSGALNEHISDVFGSLVKQRLLGHSAAKADWLIGAGLFTKSVKGTAIRSMKAPGTAFNDSILGKDPQPDHMKRYVKTNEDNGGVHINSGIPNKAFYLAATAIGGNAWSETGRIWYHTILDPAVVPNTNFKGFAKASVSVADRLHGAGSQQSLAVQDAWRQVGIKV